MNTLSNTLQHTPSLHKILNHTNLASSFTHLTELSKCIDNAGVREVVCSQSCYDRAASFGMTTKHLKVTEKIPEKPILLQTITPSGKVSANPLTTTEKLLNSPGSDLLHTKEIQPSNTSPFHLPIPHIEDEILLEDTGKLYLVNTVEDDPNQLPKHAKRSIGLANNDERREVLLEVLESFTPFPALNAIYAESLESIAGRKLHTSSLYQYYSSHISSLSKRIPHPNNANPLNLRINTNAISL